MTESRNPIVNPDDDADAALDHALRERPVDESDDYAYDDGEGATADDASTGSSTHDVPIVDDPSGTGEAAVVVDDAQEISDDAEDYVLYSEVRPHLEELVVLQEQRGKMIDLLLYARDRVSSPAVAARMDDNLGLLGIQVIVPTVGERFDPSQHEASATVPTDDASAHGTIAEVELAGYTDGDRMVRPPIVTVYSAEQESS